MDTMEFQPQQPGVSPSNPQPQPEKSHKLWYLIGAFGVGILVVGAVLYAPSFGLKGFIGLDPSEIQNTNQTAFNEFFSYNYTEGFQNRVNEGGEGALGYINRAEMARALVEGAGLTIVETATPTFPDVTADKWYYPYVETVAASNIMNGFSDGTFQPGENISRAEAMKMIIMAFDLPMCANSQQIFADMTLDNGYSTYLSTALHWDLFCIEGTTCSIPAEFEPESLARRGFVVTMLVEAQNPVVNDPSGFTCTENAPDVPPPATPAPTEPTPATPAPAEPASAPTSACEQFNQTANQYIQAYQAGDITVDHLTNIKSILDYGDAEGCTGEAYLGLSSIYMTLSN